MVSMTETVIPSEVFGARNPSPVEITNVESDPSLRMTG
jgi:hypothetical protein